MKFFFQINKCLFIILLLTINFIHGQNQNTPFIAALKIKLQKTTVDTIKISILNQIASNYKYSNAQEGIVYGEKALNLSLKNQWKNGLADANENIGISYFTLSNYSNALIYLEKALELYENSKKEIKISNTLHNIALVYLEKGNYPIAITYLEKELKINQTFNNKTNVVRNLNNIADAYFIINNYKKAITYYEQSLEINKKNNDLKGEFYCLNKIGEIYLKQKQYSKTIDYYTMALEKIDTNQTEKRNKTLNDLSEVYLLMSKIESKEKKKYIDLSNQVLKKISIKKEQYSQSLETLLESLKKNAPDTTKINILNRIASIYSYTNPKKGIRYGEEALRYATKIKWKRGIAVACENIGVCQWVLTDFNIAVNYFYKSLFAYENLKDQNGIAGAYNNLGLVLIEIKKYDLALTYFNKAFEINKENNNKVLMVYNLNNIAHNYYNQKKYNQSLEYYNKSKDLNLSMNDLNGLGYSYSKIGKIYSEQNRLVESINFFEKAIECFDKNQTYNLGNTYIDFGKTYYKMAFKNPTDRKQLLLKSARNLNIAMQLFLTSGIKDKVNDCYFELYKITKAQDNFALALNYLEKQIILKDSLFLNKNNNKLENIQSKAEIDLKDKQIEIQKLKINSESKKVYLLILITLIIAILSILFFYLYISKRYRNKLLLEKNKEILSINNQKDKFFSIIAHDLRGPFSGFLGLTELLAEDIDSMEKEEIQFSAVNMKSSAYGLSRLLDNLLEWSRMEQGLLPFSPEKYNLYKIIKESIGTLQDVLDKKNILVEMKVDLGLEIFADHHILQSVIRNIVSNAVKFTPKDGTIKIIAEDDSKKIIISVVDTGIGMNKNIIDNIFQLDVKTNRRGTDDEPSSGLGLILCKEFIEKHSGTIWVQSEVNKGSTFSFSFPHNTTELNLGTKKDNQLMTPVKAIFLMFFFSFFTNTIHAQKTVYKTIDSLKTILKKAENDSVKIAALSNLSSYAEYIGPDNTINFAKQALFYSQKTNNQKQISIAYVNLGIAYEIKSDYHHALQNFYKALEVSEKLNDTKELINLYNNIGLIYIDLKNHKQGILFYNKALALSYRTKNQRNISLLLNNIGDVYLQQEEYKKALNYFYKSLIINKKIEDTRGIGINLTNIGISFINIKNYEKGIEMLNKSLENYGDNVNLYNTYNNYELGRAYYLMSQDVRYTNDKTSYVDKSIHLLEDVLKEFTKYNSLKEIQETNYFLAKCYKMKGKYEIALNSFEKYSTIKDSIFSKETEKKMVNLEFQREISLRDQQIEIQTLRIKSDTRKFYLLVTISATVATLLGLFLFLYISKRRNNEQLKEKNAVISNINSQKDKFYSIIAHDLKGPFNGFLGLTELMAEDIDNMSTEEIKFAASNMSISAKNLFNLLENLLEWSRMEQNLIPYTPKQYQLESFVLDSIIILRDNASKKEISINTEIPNSLAIFADKNMFQAIIRNIVLNAIKFTHKKGTIYIKAIEELNNIIITVKDTGIGMSPKIINNLFKIDVKNNRIGTEDEPSTGLGLILCKEFIEKHNGKIWTESEEGNGSTFFISFPKTQYEYNDYAFEI